ncbi:ZIP zinc/iron transport family [Hypoxylon argillaceum]|nr:ZIP zinc/iron transport family [Hypoxylon argillaceum]KAI1150566.1 ZIP zinc/iron transport family [Nemania diffusa]
MSVASVAMDTVLQLRQAEADSPRTVVVDCDTGNGYDGRLGLRISSIFVILVGSFLGAVVPIILARGSKMKVNGTAFFIAKYFGSGVIIGTAFLHLLAPAFEALNNPCLPDGPIKHYDFAAAISLITVFVMFTVELLVSRFDIFGHSHDGPEGANHSTTILRKGTSDDVEANSNASTAPASAVKSGFHAPGLPNDVSYPPGGQDHLGHHREHEDDHVALAAQMTAIFILEFGVVFHSIFIGLTLAVAGDEFDVLYVVLVFHQTFEGLGLGSRLASAQWPKSKAWLPYVLGLGYALSTPISIAIGLGIRSTLQPGSANATLINGIFDSISAGILIYTGLVELLAHEFMFNEHMRNAGLKVQLFALACVALGTGLMAVLAVWA